MAKRHSTELPFPRRRGRVAFIALGLALFGLLAFGIWFVRLRSGPRPRTGDLMIAGLSAPVEVLRDSLGIPQVWAESVEDALFAQGFLHASDRLWQMEQFRRVATGRLSELFGVPALESDRFLRTLGMARAAERAVPELCAECRVRIDAYVAGVNAAVGSWKGPLPPEFLLLRTRPDPWTVTDALSIEKIMAWDLTEYDIGLLLADTQRRGGDTLLETIRPRYPAGGANILEDSVATGDQPMPLAEAHLPLPAGLLAAARVPEPARAMLEAMSMVRGSNAWVVGGSRSQSGKPVLANDMHLNLGAPTFFYLMGLHAPGFDVVGMTIPGNPGVVAGHSTAVAWGFSNAMVDDLDFFVERVDSVDETRYLTPEGSEPFQVRDEEIRVRGLDQPIDMRVRETRHGPIVTEVDPRSGQDLLALRWVGHDPSPSLEAILMMGTSRSAAEFIEALRLFRDPHLNVVFADTAGTYGYWLAGRVPLRKSGRPPLLPVPGWSGEGDWVGDLPFEDHPHVVNPARGFVVTANNRPTSNPVAALLTDHTWKAPYRAERITELLDSLEIVDAASMQMIQMDVTSSFARKHRMIAAAAFRDAEETARADSLAAWDGTVTADRREPVFFYAWLELVRFRVARELYGGAPGYFPMSVLDRMLEAGEVSPSITTGVVREAVANAGAYRWGGAHLLDLDHPLGSLKVFGQLMGFGRQDIPIGGDPFTVNALAYTGRFPPFGANHGASQRHVVDMSDPDGAGGFILPGGESGFPGNRHAFDQLPLWLEGRLVLIPLSRARAEARTESRFRLVPR